MCSRILKFTSDLIFLMLESPYKLMLYAALHELWQGYINQNECTRQQDSVDSYSDNVHFIHHTIDV